jgi:uncharacterized protein (TIGR02246 family)
LATSISFTPDAPIAREASRSETRDADEAAIRALFAELLAAWGRGDGNAYGVLFTDDADYIAFDGSRTVGGRAIAKAHQTLFDTWLKGTRLTGQVENLRFLGPDVAVLLTTGGTLMPKKQRAVRPSIQTLVAVRHGAGWRFAAFHNTRIVHRNALQWMLYGIASKLFDR